MPRRKKVKRWECDLATVFWHTYVETRRRTSSLSSAASVVLSSANGITLTQWHSDYIIAGFSSRAVRSRSLRAGESAHYRTSVFVASSRSFSRLLLRRGFFLSLSLSLSALSLLFRSARANTRAFRPDSSIILGRQMTRPPKSNERERGCRRARLVKHFARVRSLLSLFSRFMAPSLQDVGTIPPRTEFVEFCRYQIFRTMDGIIAASEGL